MPGAPIPPRFGPKPIRTATDKRAPEWIELVFWRYESLRRAGYPSEEAMELSTGRDVDLHHACEDFLPHGCPPELAAKILL